MTDRWLLPRSTASATLLVGLAQEHGVAPATLLAGTGLDLLTLHTPTAQITGQQELALIRRLVTEVARPDLGFVAGHRYHLGIHGVWAYALLTSPTMRSAIEVGLTYADLSFSFSRTRLEAAGPLLKVFLDDSDVPPEVRRFLLDRDLVMASAMSATNFGVHLPMSELHIAQRAPQDSEHRNRYARELGVEPCWDEDDTWLGLPSELLTLPMPGRPSMAAKAAERACSDALARRRQRTGFASQVREALMEGCATTDQADVAAMLNVSMRTLRRRLSDEGTTYRELSQETWGLLAEELLTSGLTVEQVAVRLGYGGTSSFTRAFKSWRGTSPGAYARTCRWTGVATSQLQAASPLP